MVTTSLAPRLVSKEARDLLVAGAPEGADALALRDLAQDGAAATMHVARDAAEAAAMRAMLAFVAPEIPVIDYPAWDCIPYDRISPTPEIGARRMAALSALAMLDPGAGPLIVVTTAAAALQRTPPRAGLQAACLTLKPGAEADMDGLAAKLSRGGYMRTSAVRSSGEFAVRGGILDVFPAGADKPLRLDFFGDALESVRSFDPETQRSTEPKRLAMVAPANEVLFDDAAIHRFRQGYLKRFGAAGDDPLYAAVSEGARKAGMEHWLPLFYDRLETVFDYVGTEATITLGHLAAEAGAERWALVEDHYEARLQEQKAGKGAFAAPIYRPLPPDALHLDLDAFEAALAERRVRRFSPFEAPPSPTTVQYGARAARSFAPERQEGRTDLFDAAARHLRDLQAAGKRVVIAGWSEGSTERLASLLQDHGAPPSVALGALGDVARLEDGVAGRATLPLERGFETESLAVLAEQDVLGDRMARPQRKRKGTDALKDYDSLHPGDHVVHIDHGVGRYAGLVALDVAGAPHDCLELVYAGGDKLYLPVENVELLTRYGSDGETVQLDKLGGAGWQARKAKLKKRLRDMADELIRIAAARKLRTAPSMDLPEAYAAFCARFPYQETEDQEASIAAVLEDMTSGAPMDRLVCGDVGFGKTEVALRAAFVAAMTGHQVAVIAPTTLLARQHVASFAKRFDGFPVRIAHLSRFVSAKEATAARQGLADGTVDIVIGTHALLSKAVAFKRLGLVIVDEEQRFGVKHKERLKALKTDVHVLTLTATPIPRTLQLALSGVRELSIIATPPVDRLAVRTYVAPFDPVAVREALLREKYRGGQSFFVCPRIADMEEAASFLQDSVPEVSFIVAHGQMAAGELEDRMTAFYEGRADVLLSTTIVESGLDIPTANTLVIHRADMFGLAQLYQLRGRVGRSKNRAYAYFTTPPNEPLTSQAERRLKALQSLDTLGAGFQVASHDLDIRGGGNLLGEEQSGHVKEVGFELYRQMLEEAVASLRDGGEAEETWSPQIQVGATVLIPEAYVPDLDVRMSLYRRLADAASREEVEAFAAELTDRFGAPPAEVEQLLDVVAIKAACRRAGVARLDAGPKGAVVAFRDDRFANPAGLVHWLSAKGGRAKMRVDQTLFVPGPWDDLRDRMRGAARLAEDLARVAEAA